VFRVPPPEFVDAGTRALRTTLAGDGPLPPVPAALITTITSDVFGHAVDPDDLAPISFADVARAIPDPGFRRQLIGGAIAMGLTVHPPDPAIARRVRELAAALDVDEPMLRAFARSTEGHRYWMLADYARHSWATDEVKREIRTGGIRKFVEQFPRMKGHGRVDDASVARWAALADLPEGSWGKAVSDFYARRHWPLPGEKGSVPLVTTHHDWVHVASGYEATPLGEIQVNAFMAAQMPDDTGLSMLFFGWSIYETGMLKVPLSPGAVGTIGSDPDNARQVADALRRGSESGVDLLDLDHWAHAERPLADIRAEFGIGPKRAPGPDSAPSVPTSIAA
jgi:hypothetical protein